MVALREFLQMQQRESEAAPPTSRPCIHFGSTGRTVFNLKEVLLVSSRLQIWSLSRAFSWTLVLAQHLFILGLSYLSEH